MFLIQQAYEWAAKLQQQELHLQELGIASLSAMFANTNRGKDTPAFKEKDFHHFNHDAEEQTRIPGAVCDAFFSLVKESLMPAWAVPLCPIDALSQGKTNEPVSKPRCWVGDGVLLLLPKIEGNRVRAAFALVEATLGVAIMTDPDSGHTFAIQVSESGFWTLNSEVELISRDGQ